MKTLMPLFCTVLAALSLSAGCYWTLEQRWEAFDAKRKQEIGVKTRDFYLSEWGKLTKRATTKDGGEMWTWESYGYGGAQGWKKTRIFASDGTLNDFSRDYWPKEVW